MTVPGNLSSPLLATAAVAGAAAAVATRSVRLNSADSANFSRTPSSASNRRTFTWAGWYKPSVSGGSFRRLFGSGDTYLIHAGTGGINSKDSFYTNLRGGSTNYPVSYAPIFRDFSAWYHIVWAVDTTQATAANRSKVYVNGVELTEAGNDGQTYPPQNHDTAVNSASAHFISSSYGYVDGYMADIYLVDGSQLDPTSFGAFDDNGVWQAAAYSGTFGTNGFHLDFADGSDLGNDNSGNGNDWTPNNLTGTQNQRFSAGATATGGFESSNPAANGFNGTLTSLNRANGVTVGGTIEIEFNPPITVSSTVGIWSGKSGFKYQINDSGSYTSVTNATEQWHDASHSGTLTNLKIQHTASNEAPGFSGIRVDGTTLIDGTPENLDLLFDVPTNGTQTDNGYGGEVSGNYCTLNLLTSSGYTLSNGNLKVDSGSGSTRLLGTIGVSSGKYYFEAKFNSHTSSNDSSYLVVRNEDGFEAGIRNRSADIQYFTSSDGNLGEYSSSNWSTSETHGFALDCDNNQLKIYKNNTLTATISITAGKTYFPGYFRDGSNGSFTFNFGARAFTYAAPSGFKTLCTTNLPTPTIADGSDHFDTKLYTGDGANSRTVSGYSFSPDFLWVKNRDNTAGDFSHRLINSVRGADVSLRSNGNEGERDASAQAGGGVETFTSDGFTIEQGTSTNNNQNNNNSTYVAWAWNAGANSNKTYTVTVVSDSGNKYRFDGHGTSAVTLDLAEGSTYVFDQSDSSNSGHPLRFSTTSDGTHNSGSEYTTGVTATGTPGSAGAKTTIVVAASAPTLYYYCSSHSGMGGQVNTNSTAGSTRLSSGDNANAYDQSVVWSNYLTTNETGTQSYCNSDGFFENNGSGHMATEGFNGTLNTTTATCNDGDGKRITFTPPSAYAYTSKVEVYLHGSQVNSVYINGTDTGVDTVANGWATVATGSGSITSMWFESDTSGHAARFAAIRIDGKILIDQGVTPPENVPTVTSVVKASPSIGLSIVEYTGTSASTNTISHGLNAEVEFILLKAVSDTDNWFSYHIGLDSTSPENYDISLNTNGARRDYDTWNDTKPTNLVFSVGNTGASNENGREYLALCFAPVAGFSHFTTYEGTGSSDPIFVYCGFRPAFILRKNVDTDKNWYLHDSTRDTFNVCTKEFQPHNSSSEGNHDALDILSNGFAIRTSNAQHNNSGSTHLVAAFAENPFQANGGLAR